MDIDLRPIALLAVLGFFGTPLAVWKLVDIAIWLFS